jgi:hypothetical protein
LTCLSEFVIFVVAYGAAAEDPGGAEEATQRPESAAVPLVRRRTLRRVSLAFAGAALVLGALGTARVLEPASLSSESMNAAKTEELEEEAREAGRKRFDKPQEAVDFFLLKRSPTASQRRGSTPRVIGLNAIPYERYREAIKHSERMPRSSAVLGKQLPSSASQATLIASAWDELGPGNIGGRTRGLVIDPSDPDTMYAAGVGGGVWRTEDGGASWTALDDMMANIAVNSLAMDPANSNVLYAGTGEGFFNADAIRGAGIFKTTDAGGSWSVVGDTGTVSDFHYVNDIVVSSNNSQRVYAATRTGILRSLTGGLTWALVLDATAVNGCLDLAIRTDTADDTVFAGCGAGAQGTIYRNTDAGGVGTWDAVFTEAGMERTSLAIAPSNQAVVYAMAEEGAAGNYRGGLHAVYRSTTGGGLGSWTAQVRNTSPTKLNTVLLTNPVFAFFPECGFGPTAQFFNQGWYDNVLAVDPADPNRVWAGGIDLFRSDDGGANWGLASYWWANPVLAQYAHADQHTIAFHPGYDGTTNKTMFVGNDGGLFTTLDARAATSTNVCSPATGGISWSDLNNGYAVTQFYDGVPYPDGDTYFGGTQDNGTVRGGTAGGPNAWDTILGGDGGYVAVDPTDTDVLYAENFGLSIQKSTNGGASFANATFGIDDDGFLFISPFIMDRSDSQRLWTGGWYIWRTGNGADEWERASALTPGLGSVSALATAPTNANRALVAMSDGIILRNSAALSADSTTSWPSVTPRSGYVSSVAFDPTNADVAYATYSTFGGGAHVWKSTDGGATWTGIDGSGATGLPDIPAHSVVVDPSNSMRLYVGTDLGVYVTQDGGTNWAVENTGFANVVTEKLAVNTIAGTSTLYAFTHGRGAFKVSLGTNASPTRFVADFDGNDKDDVAVWRPSNGTWYLEGQWSGTQWGQAGDVPVPGNYDADAADEMAVFRPSNGTWYVNGEWAGTPWGQAGDIPVPGNYDADAADEMAVFRPASGTWYVLGEWSGTQWGQAGDVPVPGNYDGLGADDFAVFRPASGTWYVNGEWSGTQWGQAGDVPLAGDFDADPDLDKTVWRPAGGFWYTEGNWAGIQWGQEGDIP